MSTIDTFDFSPKPAPASSLNRIRSQSQFELRLLLANGEQILLTLLIPLILLVAMSMLPILELGPGKRVDIVLPGIIALAIMSTAFTALAISVGFDRRYGVLKLLGATPITRFQLLISKLLAITVLEIVQVIVACTVAWLLGWSPRGNPLSVLILCIAGTAAFAALGMALAGLLRAEVTLAAANGIYILLLLGGGILIPSTLVPTWLGDLGSILPSGALGDGLREVMAAGDAMPWTSVIVLLCWFVVGAAVASRTFRWE